MTESQPAAASLIDSLGDGALRLLRSQAALARLELRRKMARAGRGLAAVAVGLTVLFVGLQAMVAGAVLGLAPLLGWWGAAMVVGGVVTVCGIVLVLGGAGLLRLSRQTPERLMASLTRTAAWASGGQPPAQPPVQTNSRGNQWSTGNGT